MPENSIPRQILREILQGTAPSRPLFAPIVFGLAARLENLPLRTFLANPTKISNALQQARGALRSDSVTCYFDPMLEVEACGGEAAVAAVTEEVTKWGRVPVALEVIKRLKTIFRNEALLTVGVAGPFTLATQLAGSSEGSQAKGREVPESAMELAAAAVTSISKAFAEAGANLIFLREQSLQLVDGCFLEQYASLIAPICNIVRFYEALPVLQVIESAVGLDANLIQRVPQGCVLCLPMETVKNTAAAGLTAVGGPKTGISLPVEVLQPAPAGSDFDGSLRQLIRDVRPVLVTTIDDAPNGTDVKRIAALAGVIRTA